MGQGDHSKLSNVTLKIPDPVVAFHQFQSKGFFVKLQHEIYAVIYGSKQVELPEGYWNYVRYLLVMMRDQHSTIQENLIKYSSAHEVEEIKHYLSHLSEKIQQLYSSYERLLNGSPDDTQRTDLVSKGLSSCQYILHEFADRQGLLFTKAFQTAIFFLAFYGIYRSFSKLFGENDSSRQRKEMECLDDTLNLYKNACIEERLGNIKLLRSQIQAYNVHDYSYEAQIRKDVSFGGAINDYFDKRPPGEVTFRSFEVIEPSQADTILDNYKEEVKIQYHLFFCFEEQQN